MCIRRPLLVRGHQAQRQLRTRNLCTYSTIFLMTGGWQNYASMITNLTMDPYAHQAWEVKMGGLIRGKRMHARMHAKTAG